jgi:hypothetical protein
LSGDEFRCALASLNWSIRGLADMLGVQPTVARRWAGGVARVPPDIAAWLTGMAGHIQANPPPRRHRPAN